MAQIETWFNQDLKKPVKVRYLDGNVFSQDEMGNIVGVNVFSNGASAVLSGTVTANIIRADGATLSAAGTVSGNKASVALPSAAYAVPGPISIVIKLSENGSVTTLCAVVANVYQSSTDAAVDPGTIIPSIDALIEAINEAVASIPPDYSELVNAVYGTTRNLWVNPLYNANGVVLTQNADGSLHIQGTPSDTLFIDYYYPTALETNAYTFSCYKTGTASGNLSAVLRNSNNTAAKFLTLSNEQYNASMVISYAPYRCEIVVYSGVSYNCNLYVQLEAGTLRQAWIRHDTAVDAYARQQINALTSANVLAQRANNYIEVLRLSNNSMIERWGSSNGVVLHNGSTVQYSIATANNGGFFLDYFQTSSFILQTTRIRFNLTITSGTVRLWMFGKTKGTGTDNAIVLQAYSSGGAKTLDIDFAYYDVYSTLDVSKPIRFLFSNGGEQVASFTVSSLVFMSQVTNNRYIIPFANGWLYQALDNIVSMIPADSDKVYLTSPNGSKWMLNVSNAGQLGAIHIVPNKSVFIGNSLLRGWVSFGMAASDEQHDYYYHVTNKIHELDSAATYDHLSSGNLEHATTASAFNAAFDTIKPYLTSDVDLICIQLGDNVNTSEKIAQFEGEGGSFDTMVSWIRENCPNTRLVWVGTWYTSIHSWLVSKCTEENVEFIDILPLATTENKAKLGDVVHRTQNYDQTLTGTYTVSGNSLVISAEMYGTTYSGITVPSYNTVQNNGDGTFTFNAPYTVIDSTGVASHPGDAGMLAIANRICYSLGITSSESDIQ